MRSRTLPTLVAAAALLVPLALAGCSSNSESTDATSVSPCLPDDVSDEAAGPAVDDEEFWSWWAPRARSRRMGTCARRGRCAASWSH
ncbi:hypothetical protein [Nocardioides sp. GY 10127]|uniref:hypothetical protein n=1 Tax=Nocardioides sp. GY 10127 TaxID=2569762 RepID=UPI001458EBFA|nr:hypothetical protein [Nocardioides sp. GY 10127]